MLPNMRELNKKSFQICLQCLVFEDKFRVLGYLVLEDGWSITMMNLSPCGLESPLMKPTSESTLASSREILELGILGWGFTNVRWT
jgi:hypothetical protein